MTGGDDETPNLLLNTSSIDHFTTTAWKAISGGGGTKTMQGAMTCYPTDGAAVVEAVQGSDCTVIMLTRNYFDPYIIKTPMVVAAPKIIMGNPLTLPALQPAKTERLFHGWLMRVVVVVVVMAVVVVAAVVVVVAGGGGGGGGGGVNIIIIIIILIISSSSSSFIMLPTLSILLSSQWWLVGIWIFVSSPPIGGQEGVLMRIGLWYLMVLPPLSRQEGSWWLQGKRKRRSSVSR